MTKYPIIENADYELRKISLRKFGEKCKEDDLASLAMVSLTEELNTVRRLNAASGYLVLYDALKAVGAKAEDIMLRGQMATSMIMYALGFIEICPESISPPLYPEFLWGLEKHRDPVFEMRVTNELMDRLKRYFENNTDGVLESRYCEEDGELWVNMKQDDCSGDYFYMLFTVMDEEKDVHILNRYHEICDACSPKTYEDEIRCFCLALSIGAWEENTEKLLSSGKVVFDELISSREDVYEILLKHGLDKYKAYEITEEVRKGKICSKGWDPKMLDTIRAYSLPKWFIKSCRKTKYLAPRIYGMIYHKRYVENESN